MKKKLPALIHSFSHVLFFLLFLPATVLYSQTTVTISNTPTSSTYWSTSASVLVFGFRNTNPAPVRITGLSNYAPASHNATYTLWYHTSNITGAPTDITAANGWVQVASAPVTNATAGVIPFFSGLSLVVPSGATYRIALSASAGGPYYGPSGSSPNLVTASGVELYTQDNVNSPTYVGYFPGPIANTPRGFYGSVTFQLLSMAPNNAGIQQLLSPSGNFCTGPQNITVDLRNNGNNMLNNVQVNWMLDGVLQTPINYTTPVDTFGSVAGNSATISLGNVLFANTARTIKVWTSLPNGVADTINHDDTLEVTLRSSLNGNYTIGGASPDFATVGAAITTLNTYGVCGPVVFNIRPGTYTGQHAIGNISGASATNTITFKSELNDAAGVTLTYGSSTAAASSYTLKLDGSSYIRLKHLTISGTSATYNRALEFAGAASHNLVDSCIISAPTATSSTANNVALYGSPITGRDNVFRANQFLNGSYGTYWRGTGTTNLVDSTFFEGNTFTNAYSYSGHFYYTNNLVFDNNTITSNSAGTHYGIYVYYSDGAQRITRNKVYIEENGYGIYSYYNDGSSAARGTIANNQFVIGASSTSATCYGIYMYYASNQDIHNNSVSTLSTSATSYGGYFYFSSASYVNNNILNNVFANNGGGRAAYIYNAAAAVNNVFDYNNYYTASSSVLIQQGTPSTSHNTLTAWRTASGQDKNSVRYNPGFTSNTNLTPNPANANSWSLNGRGIHITGNVADINNNSRPALQPLGVPDIGAYEFTPSVIPPATVATPPAPAAGITQVFTFGEDTVAVINWGSSVPASFPLRQYTGTVPPSLMTPGDSLFFYVDAAAASGTYDYTPNVYYKEHWLGTLSESVIALSKKDGSSPWNALIGTSVIDLNRNILSGPGQTVLPSLFTAIGVSCAGMPQASFITTPPLTNSKCLGDSITLAATDPNNADGIVYQWQQAPSSSGPWTNVSSGSGASTLNYTSAALNDTVYFRLATTCTYSSMAAYSDTFEVEVVVPVVSSTVPATRCGPGTVTLQAGSPAGTVLSWFNTASGGSVIDTGSTFVTPFLTGNTTFYVSASTGSSVQAVGPVNPASLGTGGFYNYDTYKTYFTVNSSVTISSVDIFPSATGVSSSINILSEPSGSVVATVPYTTTVSGSTSTGQTVPMNITLAPGTYSMRMGDAAVSLYRNDAGATFPYSIPAITITGQSFSGYPNYYYYFYNWKVGSGCESARVPVTATVTPSTPISASATTNPVCEHQSTPLTATSTNANYQYTWSPAAGLSSTTGNTVTATADSSITYTVSALDPVTNCAAFTTVSLTALPAPLVSVTPSDTAVCMNENVQLLTTASGYDPNAVIGTGTSSNTATSTTINGPYAGYSGGTRQQYLFLGYELQSAGLTAGPIDFLEFDVAALNSVSTLGGYTIKMDSTNISAMTTTFIAGLPTVYSNVSYMPVNGWNHHNITPFVWDGTSNIVVEICFNNNSAGYASGNASVRYTATSGLNTVTYYRANNDPNVCSAVTGTTSVNRPNIRFGYTSPLSYQWSPVTGLSSDTVGSPMLTAVATNDYVITVTDGLNGCYTSDTIPVTVNPIPVVDLGNDTVLCSNSTSGFFLDATGPGLSYVWQDSTTSPTYLVTAAGLYYVTATNPGNCRNSDSVTVTLVNPVPADIDVNVTSVNTATLDAGTGFVSYLWSDFTTGQSLNITGNGTYWVMTTDMNGCTSSDTVTMVFSLDVLNPDGSEVELTYYPNPSQGIVNFSLQGLKADRMQLEVMDMSGKKVFGRSYENVQETMLDQLDLTHLSAGTYLVRLSTEHGTYTNRIVITRP